MPGPDDSIVDLELALEEELCRARGFEHIAESSEEGEEHDVDRN